ncbi:MAG: DUF1501 domain-containing protein [Pirellulaceae bacterium]|nr:DUF1501 domain-containing protein [Pirellulaceae bacterium]
MISPSGTTVTRRELLRRTACGFGNVALMGLLARMAQGNNSHFRPRAKQVIFLFMHGGVSHIDSFDPKPELEKYDGQPLPYDTPLQFAEVGNLMKSPWKFRRYGQSGLPVSDLFPQIGDVIDDICLVRSMHVEQVDHGGAILQLHTGSAVFTRPSMGAWVAYGLGSENDNLPGFITISPPMMHGAQQNYGSAFLPAAYQGTAVGDFKTPMTQSKIRNLMRAEPTAELQRMQLDLIQDANRQHAASSASDLRLEGRIESLELAFRMQMEAPQVLDTSGETQQTYDLYGINGSPTDNFGRQCLLARRLVENGVRFVQCSHSYKWDQHGNLRGGHSTNAHEVDQPVAALIIDLKQRGLLDDTLVVWGTEFGRTPVVQGNDGRDHNPYGFTMWMAGGGVKPGMAYGSTDEFGYFAQDNKVSMYDFHATMLYLLGIEHTALTYHYAGRDFRLTDVFGHVVKDVIA